MTPDKHVDKPSDASNSIADYDMGAADLDEKLLSILLDHFPGMAFRCRNDAPWTMYYVSKGSDALTGYPPESFVGKNALPYESIIHPEDRLAVRQSIETKLAENQSYQVKYRIRTANGKVRWVYEQGQEALEVASNKKRLLYLTGFITDMTPSIERDIAHEKLQAQMLHNQKLKSLGIMAGGIAHDFNNILTGIIGHADIALSELHPHNPITLYLQEIIKASNRAAKLVQQMLTFAGRGLYKKAPLDAGVLIQEILPQFKASIPGNIKLHLECPGQPLLVYADKEHMHAIFMNLLMNAVEALREEDGEIWIRLAITEGPDSQKKPPSIASNSIASKHYVTITIADNGCGMTPEVQTNLFDPFFTTKFEGRGLGMASVSGIVRSHNGAIHVDSVPEQGSTIKVLLPLYAPEAPTVKRDTILLIDDEEYIRKMVGKYLEQLYYKVLIARDGKEGVALYQEHQDRIRVVLLDVTMPVQDGSETFRQLRQINPAVRVILSSGFSEYNATSRFAGKGLAGFLQKPYSLQTLRAKLEEVSEGE